MKPHKRCFRIYSSVFDEFCNGDGFSFAAHGTSDPYVGQYPTYSKKGKIFFGVKDLRAYLDAWFYFDSNRQLRCVFEKPIHWTVHEIGGAVYEPVEFYHMWELLQGRKWNDRVTD